ncbi:MAG: hypothetical protein ABIP94_04745 [Planctomycetota bacterium]
MNRIALLSMASALTGSLLAQSNTVPGLNGRLTVVDDLTYYGRRGAAYPNGEVGMAMLNEMCNPGTVTIPWFAAMQPNHPKFGFLIVRVAGGRIEQISDRSMCKHAFVSTNFSGPCGSCINPGTGTVMGVNCSDTYGAGNNADRTWLGPADEIDPWLGVWNPVGSYFDIGDPSQAGYPLPADGVRSLNSAGFDSVKNRVTVKEADLLTPGAQYFYGIHLIHQGEALANRGDNLASRGMTPAYGSGVWSFGNNAVAQSWGSILQQWPGASVSSGSNGNNDGRFFVASKVAPLGGGLFRYEYAVHNADNNRGGATFRLPIDANATASNFTFRDIDSNALNNWVATRVGNEIVFTAPANNPLNWNTIYNFGFDANYQPADGVSTFDEARMGPGALTVSVPTRVPSGGPALAIMDKVGSGCGAVVCERSFYEFFPNAGSFDLANSKWSLTFANNSYTVGASTSSFVTPLGPTLALGDDSEASVSLPFPLPYPGGSTSTLVVGSNGYVGTGSNGSVYDPTVSGFLGGSPRWSGLWHDLDPSSGGAVRVDSSATVVRITFLAVPNFGGGGAATFQYQFQSNGTVHVIYQTVNVAGNAYLVGYTPGGGASNPGSIDISTALSTPFTLCGSSAAGVALDASARPVLGTTVNYTTSNIPAGTLLGLQILGLTQHTPPLDLASYGMPGCKLYLTGDLINQFATSGSSATVPLVFPSTTSLTGAFLMTQSATLSPGFNPFGFLTSNGIQMVLGMN